MGECTLGVQFLYFIIEIDQSQMLNSKITSKVIMLLMAKYPLRNLILTLFHAVMDMQSLKQLADDVVFGYVQKYYS